MDALSEILRAIHLSGTAFIDAELAAPWAIQTPTPSEISRCLSRGAGRILPYHLIVEGSCIVRVGDGPVVNLRAHEVACFPQGDVHVLASEAGLKPLRVTADMVVGLAQPGSISRYRHGGKGVKTRLICGFFACDRTLSDQLIAPLPRLLTFEVGVDSPASLLAASAQAATGDSGVAVRPGSQAILCKLSELLFIDAVRSYVQTLPEHGGGWLAGLQDCYVSHALALLHEQPSIDWTLEQLAARVGTSRTTLADRFTRYLGMSPMQYAAHWRMRSAAHTLASTDRAIKKIAADAGFGTSAAFGRAFKREMGTSPAMWRRANRGVSS